MGNLNSDPRLEIDGAISDLGGGVWEGRVTSSMNPASFRINVRTTNPNAFDIGAQLALGSDWAARKAAGYTVDAKDFRNVEMTGYWKVTQWSDDDEYSFYSHGGHNTDGWPEACLGTQYKGQIQRAGNPRFAKEYHHLTGNTGYVFSTAGTKFTVSARNNSWIGQKVCVYDTTDSTGKTIVMMEVWSDMTGEADPTKQDWKLMQQTQDAGSFGEPSQTGYVGNCNATHQQQFLWGGPSATFRIDNVIVQVKKFSLRNILGVGGAITTCPSGQHVDPVSGLCVSDGAPAQPVSWIKFYLSGVAANNNNPYDSIGGPISNVEMLPNSFNNLFDNVDPNSMKAGSKTSRLVYVRNQGGQAVSLHAYFNELDNFTGIALGTKGINQTEDPLPDDSEQPGQTSILYPLFDNLPIGFTPESVRLDGTKNFIGELLYQTASPLYNSKPSQIIVYVRKVGNPTGNINCNIRHYNGEIGLAFPLIDVQTGIPAGAQFSPITFAVDDVSDYEPGKTLDGDAHENDIIGFEYTGGTAANYVEVATHNVSEIVGQVGVSDKINFVDPSGTTIDTGIIPEITPVTDICMKVSIQTGICMASNPNPTPTTDFSKPVTYETGLQMGLLNPGDYRGVWLQRVIPPNTLTSNPDVLVELIVSV